MILVLTGPTGSGKTKLAIELAKKINAEIVNADAFQVYDELNIATAKPSNEELSEIPHHLIGFVPLSENYDVSRYQKDARDVISSLLKANKNIIFAGGTGLYIRAALFDYSFSEEKEVDMTKYDSFSNEELHNELKKIDPKSADEIHMNNRQRVLRAIEIYLATGKTKSEIISSAKPKLLYDAKFYEIDYNRRDLYPLVEQRVEKMFEQGIVEENLSLIEKYGRNARAFCAIGVKEFFPYLDKTKTLDEVKEEIKLATRHYIKRQETFFRHQFDVKLIKNVNDILEDIYGNHF